MNFEFDFKGSNYSVEHDYCRLASQLQIVRDIMIDGKWRTLRELAEKTGFMDSSISRYLRYLRKEKHGGFIVEKKICGNRKIGLFEYRVIKL